MSTPPPRRSVGGRYLFSNWLWALIVLALIGVVFVLGDKREPEEHEEQHAPTEDDLVALFKETFDAREVDD